eukprot:3718566-Pleurochrysis_carterae.AAC.1
MRTPPKGDSLCVVRAITLPASQIKRTSGRGRLFPIRPKRSLRKRPRWPLTAKVEPRIVQLILRVT